MKIAIDSENRVTAIMSDDVEYLGDEEILFVDNVPSEVSAEVVEWKYIDGEFVYDEEFASYRKQQEENRPKTTEEKVDELTAITDDMILLMAELIGG